MKPLLPQSFQQWLVVIAAVIFSQFGLAQMQTQTDIDNVEIHYVLFPSSMVTPSTAAALGLTRSENIQLINVSVRQKQADSPATTPMAAEVTGSYFDLIHNRPMDFIEVKEKGAIYYLAPVRFPGEDARLKFTFSVKYSADKPAAEIILNRHLYRDIAQ